MADLIVKTDEIKIILADLSMALSVRKQLKANDDNIGIMSFADGERISMKASSERLGQIDAKIISLGKELKQRVVDLDIGELK